MKDSIRKRYQEFVDYIDFPTMIYIYETGRLIAINHHGQKIINELGKNINIIWEDDKKAKLSKKNLSNGSETILNKKIMDNGLIKEIDIQYNSLLLSKRHIIFCFFELSDKSFFSKHLSNQIPRIIWYNNECSIQGVSEYSIDDIINTKNPNIEIYELENSFKEIQKSCIKNNKLEDNTNKYNIFTTINTDLGYNHLIKVHAMPIIDNNNKEGFIFIYNILLSKEDKTRILNEVIKENISLTKSLEEKNEIIQRLTKELKVKI